MWVSDTQVIGCSYIQIDECHREQHDCVSLSLTETAVLIFTEKIWLLQILSDIQWRVTVPAESLLANLLPFWTLLTLCV